MVDVQGYGCPLFFRHLIPLQVQIGSQRSLTLQAEEITLALNKLHRKGVRN